MEVLVLYDFETQLDDELSIKSGDVIKNVRKAAEEGWLEGELNGKRGVFPNSFVKEIPTELRGDHKKQPRSMRKVKSMKKVTKLCEVAFAYSAQNPDELELNVGEKVEFVKEIEDGWWLGKKDGKMGAFPSNFVKELSPLIHNELNDSSKKSRPKFPEAINNQEVKETEPQQKISVLQRHGKHPERCKVMFDYTACAEDELDLKKGDIVTIIKKSTDDEGWWEGELNGKCGLFPDNFVMLLPHDTISPDSNHKPPERKGASKKTGWTPDSGLHIGSKTDASDMDKKAAGHSKLEATLAKVNQKDDKKENCQLMIDHLNKVFPGPPKKVPPPVKLKPVKNKANEDQPSVLVENEKDHPKETDEFDGIHVTSEKLSHPTANRAKPQGRRLPTHNTGTKIQDCAKKEVEINEKTEDNEPSSGKPGLPKAAEKALLIATVPKNNHSTCQLPILTSQLDTRVKGEETICLEKLKKEIEELSLGMDLLRNQYMRDIEDLKNEISDERQKRIVLQEEVELLRKLTGTP
ncbi:SH3 domain-containing protein 21 isoform X2 [Polypterus senegalus]|uniref:SH3 domain-containing protein 21 isoform X2 n=1 Tax=Polypterus senegalus TaxID=55291 RepID=UPI001963F653|nr:SH3 domain-containing protein 21 isoform X2 [Polypterus senegalus]